MVAGNENFVTVWQIAEPIHKVNCLLFAAAHGEVAGMDYYIRLGHMRKGWISAMCV